MSLLFAILLWALAIALAIFIALIVTPVCFELRLTADPRVAARCDMRVLGGWAPRVTVFNSKDHRPSPPKAEKKKGRKTRWRAKSSRDVDYKRVLTASVRLIRDVLRRIHFAKLDVDCQFGLGDPADTGQVAGLLMALEHGFPPSDRLSVRARPNFDGPCFEGQVMAVIKVTAGAFILPAIRFAWHAFGPKK